MSLVAQRPVEQWLKSGLLTLDQLIGSPDKGDEVARATGEEAFAEHKKRLQLFGYSSETLNMLLVPMFTHQ